MSLHCNICCTPILQKIKCDESDDSAAPRVKERPISVTKCGHLYHSDCLKKRLFTVGKAWKPQKCPARNCCTVLNAATEVYIIKLSQTDKEGPDINGLVSYLKGLELEKVDLTDRVRCFWKMARENKAKLNTVEADYAQLSENYRKLEIVIAQAKAANKKLSETNQLVVDVAMNCLSWSNGLSSTSIPEVSRASPAPLPPATYSDLVKGVGQHAPPGLTPAQVGKSCQELCTFQSETSWSVGSSQDMTLDPLDMASYIDSIKADKEVAAMMERKVNESTTNIPPKNKDAFSALYAADYPNNVWNRPYVPSSPDDKFMDALVHQISMVKLPELGLHGSSYSNNGSSENASPTTGLSCSSVQGSPSTGPSSEVSPRDTGTEPEASESAPFATVRGRGSKNKKRMNGSERAGRRASGAANRTPKYVYGRFECENKKCGAKWGSKRTLPNRPQTCTECHTDTLPYRQETLKTPFELLSVKKKKPTK